jgi:hypothetical protein
LPSAYSETPGSSGRTHAERGQVQVLLAAQVGHGEAADGVEIVGVAAGDHVAFDLDRLSPLR